MKLYRITIKFISFIFFLLNYFNIKLSLILSFYNAPYTIIKALSLKKRKIIFKNTLNEIDLLHIFKFKNCIEILTKILNNKKITIVKLNSNGFILQYNKLNFNINSRDNLYTFYEIFVENIYDINSITNNNIIIDIGMNVGFASLYFASLKQVSKVYSYEPFSNTFNEALFNFKLNNVITNEKINPFNFGISNYSSKIKVPQMKSGSPVGSTDRSFIEMNNIASSTNVEVEIKSIEDIVKTIYSRHPKNNLIIKIDCEGEEYAIIDLMNKSGILNLVHIMLIEWHFKGPDVIINTLNKSNFSTFQLPRIYQDDFETSINTGMIYAFNQNTQDTSN